MLHFETVSRRRLHRSNQTQKNIPSSVAFAIAVAFAFAIFFVCRNFSERALNFTIISDKSDIIEVAASDRIRTIIRFSSEIAGALNIDATVFLFCHLSDDALALLVGVLLQHICDLDQGLLGKPLECRNLEKCNLK